MAPVTLDTRRLRLRQVRDSDAAAIFAYASDPGVTTYAVWNRVTELPQVKEYLSKVREGWASGAEFTWFMCERIDAAAIGAVAVRIRGGAAELGFILNPRYWNLGYTTEAVTEVIRWLYSLPEIERIWATCDFENNASARVLEKLGLAFEGHVAGGMVRPNISSVPREALIYGASRNAA